MEQPHKTAVEFRKRFYSPRRNAVSLNLRAESIENGAKAGESKRIILKAFCPLLLV